MARNAVALVVASYLLQTFLQYSTYRDWQAQTRDLSVRAERAGAPVVFLGDVMRMPSARAALIQNPLALSFRLLQLTGVRPSLCTLTPSACTDPNLFRIDLPADGFSSAEP